METMFTDCGVIRSADTQQADPNNAFIKLVPVDAKTCRVEIHYLLDSLSSSTGIPTDNNVVYWVKDPMLNLLNGTVKSHFSAADPSTIFLNLEIAITAEKKNHAKLDGSHTSNFALGQRASEKKHAAPSELPV